MADGIPPVTFHEEIDDVKSLPPSGKGAFFSRFFRKIQEVQVPPVWSFQTECWRPKILSFEGDGTFLIDRGARYPMLVANPIEHSVVETPHIDLNEFHPSGLLGLKWYRKSSPPTQTEELELLGLPERRSIAKWTPDTSRLPEGVFGFQSLLFDQKGRLWTTSYTNGLQEFQLELRSEEANWKPVWRCQVSSPRNYQSEYQLSLTNDPDQLIINSTGNHDSFIYRVFKSSMDKTEFHIEQILATEDPVPFNTPLCFSPDGRRYLLGDGAFKFGIYLRDAVTHNIDGFAKWPGSQIGFRAEMKNSVWWLNNKYALVATSQGRLFLLNVEKMKFQREITFPDHPVKEFTEYPEDISFQRTDLIDCVLSTGYFITVHRIMNKNSDGSESKFSFFLIKDLLSSLLES